MKHTTKRTLRLFVVLGLIVALLMSSVTALAAGNISKAEAKSIALKKAGVSSSDVTKWTKVKLDNWDDDGDKEWDVEFKTKSAKYEVEINAATGAVEDFEKKAIKKKSESKTKITEDAAKDAALKKAGIDSSDVTKWTKIKLDKDEWDIKFQTATHKYEVEVNAYTGKVKDFEKKALPKDPISKEEAKAAALKKAGVDSSEVTKWTKVKLDDDEWDIKFQTATYKYEVEINARNGKVKDFEKKKIAQKSAAKISLAKAKSIALDHAKGETKISGSVKYIKAKLDRDDGNLVYEIEFKYKGMEFDYEIDANTGDILDWDIDWDD